MSVRAKYDVVIAGGGILGCYVAYFLKQRNPAIDVAVIEADPTYEYASTVRASGGARRLFSCPENIAMSSFSIERIKNFSTEMAAGDSPAAIDWVEQGYLFIVSGVKAMRLLEENAHVQRSLGADIQLLDREGLKHLLPSMHVADLDGAAYSPGDGWCDPNSFLQGTRKKAGSLGVEFISDRVAGFTNTGGRIAGTILAGGATVKADSFVNAAGPWAAQVSAMAGMCLPVSPLRRFEHYFTGHRRIEPLPYVKDLNRLAFRSEGQGFSGGLVNSDEPRGFNFDVDHGYFDKVVWPALAHRFPTAFEGVKCHRTWSGLYEQCELDGNPIIGNWTGNHENFYVVAGFSGHGMMHAPAAGRGIAELIDKGRFETIDLSRMGYERVLKHAPYRERGIL
ncbi:NAD(P)/FAD-dependent oxidoreductase [Noviherbaspirillum suwonense]|jgi:glycine/D-amino acid oxidase-like deaminating enzyme|uniref:Glycine/D-amino acid oxidase n=1 Tax=Noviherbaspirillum suwonense TaxID=1224511 RepID=A0ABY1Q7G5_9BURK|nr:FAD-binding oxidoreductase [Noviherbaspirillum suwonense]SMP60619.1 Glycine/D-amino acid oxidase [Noviherbaspirillum suwonense]